MDAIFKLNKESLTALQLLVIDGVSVILLHMFCFGFKKLLNKINILFKLNFYLIFTI
jgi:hypothetical protein